MVISPKTSGGVLFEIDKFDFGLFNITNGVVQSQYWDSLLNDYTNTNSNYTFWSNTSMITTSFHGLGLPRLSYLKFTNQLKVLTQGKAQCVEQNGGICWLNNYCQNYNYLWQYSFRLRFANSTWSNYLNIPLSTFAQNQRFEGNNYCVFYIEGLNTDNAEGRSIILGSMFYQVFYVQYQYYGFNGQ